LDAKTRRQTANGNWTQRHKDTKVHKELKNKITWLTKRRAKRIAIGHKDTKVHKELKNKITWLTKRRAKRIAIGHKDTKVRRERATASMHYRERATPSDPFRGDRALYDALLLLLFVNLCVFVSNCYLVLPLPLQAKWVYHSYAEVIHIFWHVIAVKRVCVLR